MPKNDQQPGHTQRCSLWQRLKALLLCYGLFCLLYFGVGKLAPLHPWQGNLLLAADKHLPFVEFLLLPYLSSLLFFALVFFVVKTPQQLRLLVWRINAMTILACSIFLLFPCKQQYLKPEGSNALWRALINFIGSSDNIYNQAPSLHVCYAVVYWQVLLERLRAAAKYLLGAWLAAIVLSTVLVYQHHLLDVTTALLAAALVYYYSDKPLQRRCPKRRAYQFLFAGLLLLNLALLAGWLPCLALPLLAVSISLLLVSHAYFSARHDFLKKTDGRLRLAAWLLHWPYILGNWCVWKYYRAKTSPCHELLPGLSIGARLQAHELQGLFAGKQLHIYDLCAELPASSRETAQAGYHCHALLDMVEPCPQLLESISRRIVQQLTRQQPDQHIYIHCTLGYWRSVLVAKRVLGEFCGMSEQQALQHIRSIHPHAL